MISSYLLKVYETWWRPLDFQQDTPCRSLLLSRAAKHIGSAPTDITSTEPRSFPSSWIEGSPKRAHSIPDIMFPTSLESWGQSIQALGCGLQGGPSGFNFWLALRCHCRQDMMGILDYEETVNMKYQSLTSTILLATTNNLGRLLFLSNA
jgi:hypothetical protein